VLNPDFAVGVVARRLKPKRNAQLEQFFDEGISVDMVRKKMCRKRLHVQRVVLFHPEDEIREALKRR
jgi:hypothetical protein